MKKALFAILFCASLVSFAQKEKKREDMKFLYKETTIETDDYKIYIIDAVSNVKVAKFKIKIFNKTNDYLLIKPEEFKYLADGKSLLGKDKAYTVPPNEEVSSVIDFKGADMLSDKYSVELKGIYKASAGGKSQTVPNFEVPLKKNDFTIDNLTCVAKKHELETDKSFVKFECTYIGDGVEIINVNKASSIMPSGKENANSKKSRASVLEKGSSYDFTLQYLEIAEGGDMQKQPWQIVWNDSFKESKLLQIGNSKIELVKEYER